jgi:threonine dehydratase
MKNNQTHYEKILEAKKQISPYLSKTPLIYSKPFSDETNNQIYIKPENLQKTGAFKIRGAFNKLLNLPAEDLKKGVITASAGNHAQGVALASKELGANATIVMPKATPVIKVNATKAYGANVVLHGNDYDEAYEHSKKLEKELNLTYVHPFDDYDIIYGQGTIAIEIYEELKDADFLLVPIGGGGLISGMAIAAKHLNPAIQVLGVEPEGAMSMKTSLKNKQNTSLPHVQTIADGVAVKRVGNKTFSMVNQLVDGIITVSDYDIMDSFLFFLEKHKMVCESAGALSLAALKKMSVVNKKVVCLVSGGNIDMVTVSSMITKGLLSRNRIFCFSVDLPDTPGELLKIASLLEQNQANVIKLDHNQFQNLDRFIHVQLQVTVETSGIEQINTLKQSLKDAGYSIKQIY